MTETDEKHENPEGKKSAKQGLHGWKAALAMFGCGSLAAFGVFGIILALAGSFLSIFSGGVEVEENEPNIPQDTANPREEFDGEKFDLCGISEDVQGVNLTLAEYPAPEDSSMDGGQAVEDDLVRSGECSGELAPSAGGEPWEFQLSYSAVIYSPQGDENELARSEFDDVVGALAGPGGQAPNADFLDEARSGYEGPVGEGAKYSLVALKRSAVIEIEVASPEDRIEGAFFGELKQLERRYDLALNANIPD